MESIKSNTKIPVLGDADGVCHVYVHSDADLEMAAHIIRDSKVDNRGVGSAMGSILLHAKHWETDGLEQIIQPLLDNGVAVSCGRFLPSAVACSEQYACCYSVPSSLYPCQTSQYLECSSKGVFGVR